MKKDFRFPVFWFKRLEKIRRIMRLTVFFMLAGIMQISANVYSQGNKMSVRFTEITLSKLFWEVQQETDFVFVYSTDDLQEKTKPISISLKDATIQEFMEEVLKGTDLTYTEINNVVVIKKDEEKIQNLQLKSEKPQKQEPKGKKITGKVKDKNGTTLPGVSVLVKGTTIGVATDTDGNFELLIPEDKNRIRVSFVGFVTQEVEIGNVSDFLIVLENDMQNLDNIVVTGYQTLSRERTNGSFVSVRSADLDKQIGATSLTEKLQSGMIPGVVIDNNNNITIRGKSSLNASTSPIIVVDGFPTETSINNINPNDIASITVLRDAAAASIWGARASNGVIVVTTKSGKGTRVAANGKTKNKAVFDFSSSIKITEMPDLGDLHLASPSTTVDYQLEQLDMGYWNVEGSGYSLGQSLVFDAYRKQHQGLISESEANAIYDQLRRNNFYEEGTDLFFRNSLSQQYNLTVSGATELNNYYVSVNYQNNKAYSRGNNNENLNFIIKNSMQLLPKLRFDVSVGGRYRKTESNGISTSDLTSVDAYERILDDEGNYVPSTTKGYLTEQMSYEDAREWESKGYHSWMYNLKQEYDNKDNTSNYFSPRVNLALNYNILEGLRFDSKFVYEQSNSDSEEYDNMNTYATRSLINKFTIIEDGKLVHQLPNGPILYTTNQKMSYYALRNQLSFDRSFNDSKHKISAILGTEINRHLYKRSGQLYCNYDRDKLLFDLIDSKSLADGSMVNYKGNSAMFQNDWHLRHLEEENRYFSVYANGSYTYNQKYTIEASARIDESNLFGADVNDRITPLYSVSGGWIVSKEDFFDVNFIDYLKVRASTGVNGNIDKSTSKELIAEAKKDYFTQVVFLDILSPENRELKWESTRTNNLGLDFSILNNRISGSMDLYWRKSFDLLGYVNADPTNGFEKAYKNTAEVENKGFDLGLNGVVLEGEFHWDMGFNISYNKNEVTKVYNPNPTVYRYLYPLPGYELEGMPIDHVHSYRWAGLSSEGEPQIYDDAGNIVSWEESDLEHPEWLVYEGTRVPKFVGAFSNTWSYNGLMLNAIFSYKLGHIMRMPSPEHNIPTLLDDISKRWQNPGDEENTYVPKMPSTYQVKGERSDFYKYSDFRSQSASYIRLNTLSLTYNLPKSLIGSAFETVQLQAQGRNLWLWTKNDENIDPETSSISGDLRLGVTPEYTFGIRVQF